MIARKFTLYSCAALCAATIAASSARAEPDPDPSGAVRALWSIPFDAAGDAIGAGGLISAAVIGGAGDVVALVDHNEFTHPFLRGIASTGIRRSALGLSHFGTGALEGFRNTDFPSLPESEATYLRPDGGRGHLRTLGHGFGAAGLAIVDTLSNTGLFVVRAVGATEADAALASAQTSVRTAWVGPATDGNGELGIVELARAGN